MTDLEILSVRQPRPRHNEPIPYVLWWNTRYFIFQGKWYMVHRLGDASWNRTKERLDCLACWNLLDNYKWIIL